MKNKAIEEILTRSIDAIYPSREVLEGMLKTDKKLRVYMGIDPTATYAHLGHATNYIVLKRLHDLGHKIIVLIGDFTAMIGDPSDKTAARKRLTKEQVSENLRSFKEQIGKILDFNDVNNPIEFRFNSEWLSKLNFEEIVDLSSNFTVQQMIERDVFKKRVAEKKPLYVHEFFYPLMQGYDSVALEADVEIGGTDQTFNMLAGRTLVKAIQNREKVVVTTTLLENPVTGEKLMSKSLGTGIGLDEEPNEMYGKTMALPDEAIIQCFIDCTYLTMDEIRQLESDLKSGTNPRDIKARLAFEIVKMYHNAAAAQKAQENFENVFSRKENPENIEERSVESKDIVNIMVEVGYATSKSGARRLVEQKAVRVDGEVVDLEKQFQGGDEFVLNVGKLKFAKVKIK